MELLAIAQEEGDVKGIQKATDAMEHYAKQIDKTTDAFKELTDEAEALGRMDKRIEKFAATFLGIKKSSPGIIKDFVTMTRGAGGFSGALKDVGGSFAKIINPASIATSLFSKMVQSTILVYKETDTATASLAAATGATSKYNSALQNNWRGLVQYGMGIGDLGASMESLHANMLTSTELSQEQQIEFALTSAKLTKFGVSVDTTSGLFDTLVKAMGFTGKQANKMAKGLVNLAQDLQMPPKMLIEGFAESSKYLSVYGKKAFKVFKKVAAAAKATGIATGRLFETTKQFNTFEGAARAAGTLNAMLGGDLVNSMELVTATDEERIAILQRVGAAAKQQFQGLSESNRRYQAMGLASALSIETDEMMKLMNTTGDALDQYNKKAEESETDQQKLNKALAASTETIDKLAGAIKLFSVPMGKLIDKFDQLVQKIFVFDEATGEVGLSAWGEEWGGIALTIAGIVGSLGALSFVKVLAGFGKMTQAAKTAAAAAQAASTASGAATGASTAATSTRS